MSNQVIMRNNIFITSLVTVTCLSVNCGRFLFITLSFSSLKNQLEAATRSGNLDGIEDILLDVHTIMQALIPKLPPQLQSVFSAVEDQNYAMIQRFKSDDGSVDVLDDNLDIIANILGDASDELEQQQ